MGEGVDLETSLRPESGFTTDFRIPSVVQNFVDARLKSERSSQFSLKALDFYLDWSILI